MAVLVCLCLSALVGAGPALAGTTNASTLTKTGTDASTGSTATATSTIGKTAPGDTINWVLSDTNTTGSSANVNLTDPIGANQTFVPGSLQTPPGLSPAWSTNAGGSFTSTEPGSGVNAIRAAGTSVDGSTGAQSLFSAPLSSFSAGASHGDGWEALFIGPDIWNIHHHTLQSAAGDTIVDCHVAATGAECPGYPAIGQTVPTTAGTPLGTAQPPSQTIVTAFHNNGATYNGRVYFASAIAGTTNIGVSCVDTTNNTSCGYTQLGTSANRHPGRRRCRCPDRPGEPRSAASTTRSAYSNGAPVYLLGHVDNLPCAGWTNPSSVPGFTAGPYGAASSGAGLVGRLHLHAARRRNGQQLAGLRRCGHRRAVPRVPEAQAQRWQWRLDGADSGRERHGDRNLRVQHPGLTATYQCYSISGTPIVGPAPFASVIPAGRFGGAQRDC